MFISISQNNPEPMHQQITEQIKELVINGELKAGDSLPSIRNLAKDLTVSIITVKRSYADLENDGYIVTRQGLGSFVGDISKQNIKELKKIDIEKNLFEIYKEGKIYGINASELINMIRRLEDEGSHE